MTINSIRYFVEAARAENITAAAKVCYISQQALSKEIANLEKELGVSLFHRSVNHISLSQVGKQLLPIASAMLESFDFYSNTLRATAEISKKSLRVLFENDVMIRYIPYDMLGRIGDTYINTAIAQTSEQCIQDVRQMKADIAMLNRPPASLIQGLSFIELKNNPAYVIVGKQHPFADREYVTIGELRNEDMIFYDINTFFQSDFLDACGKAGFYPKIKAVWPHLATVMAAVAAGEGYSIGGNFVAPPYEEALVWIRLEHRNLRHVVGFITNPENPKTQEIESYIRALQSI